MHCKAKVILLQLFTSQLSRWIKWWFFLPQNKFCSRRWNNLEQNTILNSKQTQHRKSSVSNYCTRWLTLSWLKIITLKQNDGSSCRLCSSPSSSAHISPVISPEVFRSIWRDVIERGARDGLIRASEERQEMKKRKMWEKGINDCYRGCNLLTVIFSSVSKCQ